MVYPQLYLGQIPTSAAERRVLRARALDLHAALRAMREPEPTYALLNFAVDDAPGREGALPAVELLLLRPSAVIVAVFREYPGPIEVTPEGRWSELATGAAIRDESGWTPLQIVRALRDAVRTRLNQEAARLLDLSTGQGIGSRLGLPDETQPFERLVGALVCVPAIHPESRISLDVDDHRQWLKILGMDELAGLAAMVRIGAQLSDEAMRVIVGELFAGRLWHDGERLLFELARDRFQLRLLGEGDRQEAILSLIEGENVVGRRQTARRYERRVTLSGDDLVSSDHARIICGDNERVTLHDTSKNGTWVTLPGGAEERLRGAERAIVPGALLRMGMTRMRLEYIDDIAEPLA